MLLKAVSFQHFSNVFVFGRRFRHYQLAIQLIDAIPPHFFHDAGSQPTPGRRRHRELYCFGFRVVVIKNHAADDFPVMEGP